MKFHFASEFLQYTTDLSGLYILKKCSHYSIDSQFLEKTNQKSNKQKPPSAWLSDSSFNPASYNKSVSNIYSVPPLYQTKCVIFINLMILYDPYAACMIIAPSYC